MRTLGVLVLGFRVSGFRVLGFRVFGLFWVLGFGLCAVQYCSPGLCQCIVDLLRDCPFALLHLVDLQRVGITELGTRDLGFRGSRQKDALLEDFGHCLAYFSGASRALGFRGLGASGLQEGGLGSGMQGLGFWFLRNEGMDCKHPL